jgi:nucleoside-diphosphate-sugar epimerase
MPVRVAVAGASGFFGRALCGALVERGETVTPVTRATYAHARSGDYDVLVNAAMPSKRFWAKQHPELDFLETLQKTSDLLSGWRFRRFIHISTLSVRTEPDTVYGQHKAEAEELCRRPDCLIVRLTALYGPGMTKGSIVDIKNGGPVFVDGASRYAFTPVAFAARWVAGHLDDTGLVEVGARNSVSLAEIAAHLGKPVQFSGPLEIQEVNHPASSFPDAREVLSFAAALP